MKQLIPMALAALVAGSICANAQTAPPQRTCFPINEMRGWKAADARTIYIKVDPGRIFRLDLAHACPLLRSPGAHLITNVRGSDLICSAIDWDLAVAEPPPAAMPEHCIVKQMTLLTADQAAALPAKLRPE